MTLADNLNPIDVADLTFQQRYYDSISLSFEESDIGSGSNFETGYIYKTIKGYPDVGSSKGIFQIYLTEGATYNFISISSYDPRELIIYDYFGNALVENAESNDMYSGTDAIYPYVAPASGYYYVDANWNIAWNASYTSASFTIREDISTIPSLKGNNIYHITDGAETIREPYNKGKDLVNTSISYALGKNLEDLTLQETDDINGTGNELSNSIIGNSGNNILNGGEGADKMAGGSGNDTYIVDNIKDKVTERAGEGIDTIQTTLATFSLAKVKEVENLTYTGTSNATLTGSKSANNITGSTGNDTFDGGLGNDTLTGGAGQDTFKFTTKLSTINIDTIADFTSGDKIGLSSKIFAKLKAGVTDANICIDIAPTESNDYIIYNTSTNTLSYDADGSGTKSVAVEFAILTGVSTVDAGDFIIV